MLMDLNQIGRWKDLTGDQRDHGKHGEVRATSDQREMALSWKDMTAAAVDWW